MSLAVTTYQLSVFVHVTAVVVGLGSTFAESILFPVAMAAGRRHLPFVHRLQLAINRWMATPALTIVLATGIYQVEDAGYEWGDLWISGTLTIVLVLFGLIGAYFIPADRRLGPMVEAELTAGGDDVELSDEYMRAAKVEGAIGGLAGLLTVVAIYLMIIKPGL
jgi:uncharacterized membrane protein